MKVYIAGKFEAAPRLRDMRTYVEAHGHKVTGTWLDETVTREEADKIPGYRQQVALRDLEEIRQADVLIVDTFDESTTGGREVEVGYALGKMKHVWVVGPRRNVFHHIAQHTFESWAEAITWLEKCL